MYIKSLEELPQAMNDMWDELQTLRNIVQEKQEIAPIQDEPMDIVEAAAFIRHEVSTVYGLVAERKIPFSKPTKKLIFTKLELMNWLKEKKVPVKGRA